MSKSNDVSTLGHRPLTDIELNAVSGGGEVGYKDGKLHLDWSSGAAVQDHERRPKGQPGNGGVRYIDDAL